MGHTNEIGDVLAMSPAGIDVQFKNEFDIPTYEHGTVIMWHNDTQQWSVTHKDKPTSFFPAANYSIIWPKKD